MAETYECCCGGGVFPKGWSDEEAEAERQQLFPETPTDDCALACDDCFKDFQKWLARQPEGPAKP